MMQLNVTPDFKKRSLKFKPEFPAAAKLESVELVIPNPDGEIKTAGLSFIIYSARCGGRKLAVCDAFTGTGTITGTLNLCTDRMVDEFYHLPLGTRRSFHAVLWSEADQWMIGAGRIAIANNPGSDSMNPAPLPADRYPTFEEVEEMIRNSGGLDEPVVRRVNGIAPDNAGNVSITIPGDVSELKDKDGLTLTVQQKNTLATLSTTYASKNHTHSEYALKSELPDVSGFITADKLNLYQLKADAFSGKYADLSGKPSAFPPASHTHAVADVNGLADELSRKLTVPAGGNAGQFLMKTVSGCGWSSIDLASYITITQARNEFAAKTHEHSQYALASALQDYAAKVHTHIIGDVTGLQDALDGKAAADHNHDSVYAPKEATAAALNAKLTIPAGGTAGQVIGKTSDGYGWITVSGGVSSWNDLTDKPSAFPPATHNHVIGDVTGLENKLNEKISSVNGQVPNSSGAVTLPVATSKADGLMSAADKEKLDGLDTTGSTGDMLKSVYDTDDDGIVDHAATADAVGATTAAQVADAVGKAHTHANKATLDKLAETDGKLTFDGAEIGGASNWNDITGKPETFPPSAHNHAITDVTGLEDALQNAGSVKSVNGQLPDESGNVTVETGSTVDESRLLPENPANGDIPCFDATATVGGGNDVNTKVLLHFDELPFADTAAGNASPAAVTNSGVTLDTDNFKFGTASAKFANSSNNLKVTVPKALMMSSPWLVDCWFKVDDGQWSEYHRIFTQDDEQNGGWTYYLMSGNRVGVWVRNVTPDEPTSAALTPDDWHYATLVYYNAKFYGFIDGVRFTVQDGSSEGFLNYIMLGKRIQSTSYSLRGNIDEFRFQLLDESEISKWIGATIPVPAAPYSKPQTVGEWGKFNKSELAMKSDFPSGNIVTNVSGATADSTGYVSLKNTDEYDFSAIKNNTVPWAAPPSVLTPIGNRRVQRFYSENTDVLLLSDNSFFPFIAEELSDGRYVTLKPIDVSNPMWFGICTDGFKMEISNFTVRLHGDTDCSFEYELYGSAYEESDYSPLNGRWNLVHSGEIHLINNGDFKTVTTDIPVDSRGYYRSYAFVMKNVSGPGIISWLPEYIANNWGRLSPVLSVNGHYASANSNEIQLPAATASAAGLMAAADKVKLDSLNITEFKDRPGYFKLPGGIIVQWGAVLDVSETKTFDVTLPLAFPHLGWVSLASGTSTTVATAAYFNGANALKVVTNITGAGSFTVYWIAIGY